MSSKTIAAKSPAARKTSEYSLQYLWSSEDALANWIGFILIVAAAAAVITGAFDFSAAKFSTWGNGTSLFEQLNGSFWQKLVLTYVVLGGLLTAGNRIKGGKAGEFFRAYTVLFVLSVVVRLVSAEYTMNRYLEWAFFALIFGLIIANTVGTPDWLKPAVQTE